MQHAEELIKKNIVPLHFTPDFTTSLRNV